MKLTGECLVSQRPVFITKQLQLHDHCATLYHYFGSKRAILDELAGGTERRLFSLIGESIVYSGNVPGGLERLIHGFSTFSHRYPQDTCLLLSAQNGPVASVTRAVLEPVWGKVSTAVDSFFRDAAMDHGNMRGRSEEFTVAFIGIVFAWITRFLESQEEPDHSIVYRIMRQFSYGIHS